MTSYYFLFFLNLANTQNLYINSLFSDFYTKKNLFTSLLLLSLFFIAVLIALSFLYINEKKSKKKIKENNLLLYNEIEKFNVVLKATSDTIWDWDIKTNKFVWNKGIEDFFGYKKDEIREDLQWWFEKIHPEDSIRMSVKLYSFIEEKEGKWQDEYRFQHADGHYCYINDRGMLIKDKNDNVVRMIGAMQDISKVKLEEERLKLLETVINQSSDAIIISENNVAKTGSTPKIVYCNPAFTKMSGYCKDDILGKSIASFLSYESIRNNMENIIYALRKKQNIVFEGVNKNKNGENYWISCSSTPIFDNNKTNTHWISIQRNITSEKIRETERENLIIELTKNNKDLKQFSYIISHNLRAPLSNLTGLLALLEDYEIKETELKEIVEGFSKSTLLLNQTIEDLIKVIVIKDNPSTLKEKVNLKLFFDSIINQIPYLMETKNPIITTSFEQETLYINKPYLESIVLNLMTNALKYSKENIKPEINISTKLKNNKIEITFSDNGLGIDLEKNKDKIFGLYQRFHDYPDSKGLGLYLIKTQVESMGGTISIDSQINIGTTFKITLNNE